MRLKRYVKTNINEKVNKKEKKLALKNSNIIVGAEFEFKLDEPLSGDQQEIYDAAYKEFEEYNKSIDTYNQEIETFRDETSEMESDQEELQDKIDELDAYVSDMEEAISEWEDEQSKIEDMDVDEWEAPNESVYGIVVSTPEEEIEILQTKIDDNYDDIQSTNGDIEDYQRKYDDVDEEITDRQENEFEYIDVPEIYLPNYYEYMTDYMGYSKSDVEPEYGEKLTTWPQEPDIDNDVEYYIESSVIMDDAPFDDWEAGEYGSVTQGNGSTTWAVETDASISGNDLSGLEVKSPPMPLPKFMEYLPDMLAWITTHGYTDNQTGFHIHMSLDKNANLDPFKLIAFTEEDYIYKIFPDRINNTYVQSIKNKVKSKGMLTKSDLTKLGIHKQLLLRFTTEHNDAINIRDLASSHVEFRYMGGNDYSLDEDGVTKTIASYSYWLSLANDPDFKRKEYMHKISRMLNKIELFQHLFDLAYVMLYMEQSKDKSDKIKLDVLKRKYEKDASVLKKYYKLDKKTSDLLYDNKNYVNGVYDGIVKIVHSIAKDKLPNISSYNVIRKIIDDLL